MSHVESEHGLRVQLATALRERDEARESRHEWLTIANAALAKKEAAEASTREWLSVVEKLRENLNATLLERDDLRAENGRLREALTEIQDHGGANRGIWSQSQARAALASGGDRG